MAADLTPLPYRSRDDAIGDDVQTQHRSLRTWAVLCFVWTVGLVVWAGYLALIAFVILRVL